MKTRSNIWAGALEINYKAAFALLTLLSAGAFAETKPQVQPLSLGQGKCVNSGTGDQFMKVCWTDAGNVTYFESPKSHQQMSGLEGYAVCYGNQILPIVAYDAGAYQQGWGPASLNPAKTVVTRQTADGVLQLKQTFSHNAQEKEVTIKMELKNISGNPVKVHGFTRYFDGDIDATRQGDIYDHTLDTVSGREVNGLSLTALSDSPVSTVHTFASIKLDACSQAGLATPAGPGDYVGRIHIPMGFNLAPGKSEVATFVYRRF